MISNPCRYFATGGNASDQKDFTYEGGSKLYHFSPTDSGIWRGHHSMNVVFFANDLEHAKDILRRMLNFRIECGKEYLMSKGGGIHREEFENNCRERMKMAYEVIENEEKWLIVEAPMNQFYTVGWASNDTILG